jgi:hypothetical protein
MSETICYFQSGIGNLILATPAMQAMASLDATGMVDVLLDSGYRKDSRHSAIREIMISLPFVREVVIFGGQNGHYRRFFLPVQSETSPAGHWVKDRTPHRHTWAGGKWHAKGEHEIEANMRLATLHGYGGPTPRQFCPVADGPILSGPRPWIGICNASFGAKVWHKKRWPHFARLARIAKERFGGTVFGVGGGGELEDVSGIENMAGRLPITASAKLISQLDLFVTTDTGCMHMADALGISLIALFGPTLTSKNAPVSGKSWFLQSNLACAPCQYQANFQVCQRAMCMEMILPEDVIAAIGELKILERG